MSTNEIDLNKAIHKLERHYSHYGSQVTHVNNAPVAELSRDCILGMLLIADIDKERFQIKEKS